MKKNLYFKLAITSVRKNKRIYIPYLIIGAVIFYVFYILKSLSTNQCIYNAESEMEAFKGAGEVIMILKTGVFVVAFFAVLCIFFGNSFVMKQRKRELGLYEILGIRKAGIAKIIFFENLIVSSAAIVTSLLLGIVSDKAMLKILFRLIRQNNLEYANISRVAVIHTIVVAAIIYLIVLTYNIIQLYSLDLIQILYSHKYGEKEPKIKFLSLLIGFISLGAGYYLALSCDSTGSAFNIMFFATALVIVGIYFIFMSASIVLLKMLKRNKKIYYKITNFVSISNMLYRMKQNAVGLASICVVSTGALLVFAAGTALYVGGETSINQVYPFDAKFVVDSDCKATDDKVETLVNQVKEISNVEIEQMVLLPFANTTLEISGNKLNDFDDWTGRFSQYRDIYFIPLSAYNKLAKNNITLGKNEILYYDEIGYYEKNIVIEGFTYSIKGIPETTLLSYTKDPTMEMFSDSFVVLPTEEFSSHYENSGESIRQLYLGVDLNKNGTQQEVFLKQLKAGLRKNKIHLNSGNLKSIEKQSFMARYGGLLFVGFYLGVIFLCVTTIIIYYKQISEGYEDRIHYGILRKVGMIEKEVNACINKQVLFVFFTPVFFAIINMCVALKIVWLFLGMVITIDLSLFQVCVAVISILFIVVYTLVYFITSRIYYKIARV